MIDAKDAKILSILQSNARVSNAEIARRVGMAPSAALDRIRKLEARGVIERYETRVEPRAVGRGLLAFVFVRADEPIAGKRAGERLAAIPEALEVHHVAGEDCYLVKIRAADPEDLGRLLRDRFGAIRNVRSTRSTIVLGTLKETTQMPLPEPAARAATAERAEKRREARRG
jgi:Lrp/AsnC family leucine-responsive transcriptional regulator